MIVLLHPAHMQFHGGGSVSPGMGALAKQFKGGENNSWADLEMLVTQK